jgi:uncharacterized protein YprB with RNaseH-like and TPR domain
MSTPRELHRKLDSLSAPQPEDSLPMPPTNERGRVVADLRAKLRSWTKTPQPSAPLEPITFRRDLPHTVRRTAPPLAGRGVILEQAVKGTEQLGPKGGRVFLVQHTLTEPEGKYRRLSGAFASALNRSGSGLDAHWEKAGVRGCIDPGRIVFLDLETTGLCSSPLFLIGAMVWQGDGLVVNQYFARTYAEEHAALSLFHELAAPRDVIITFNGKTFDVPYVRARSAASGLPWRRNLAHLDLLHVSRRVWKGKLPDCRLRTLETRICGRLRHGDIPGDRIPDAYHSYVRTGNAVEMVQVLEHNFLDLVTLADLMVHLAG